MENIDINSFEVFQLKDGDQILFHAEEHMTRESAESFMQMMRDAYPGVKMQLIVGDGIEVMHIPAENMSFGQVLEHLKQGRKATRDGWNGKDMFVFLVPGSKILVDGGRPLGKALPELAGTDTPVTYRSHIDMWTADGEVVPWIASQSDLLADDWRLV